MGRPTGDKYPVGATRVAARRATPFATHTSENADFAKMNEATDGAAASSGNGASPRGAVGTRLAAETCGPVGALYGTCQVRSSRVVSWLGIGARPGAVGPLAERVVR